MNRIGWSWQVSIVEVNAHSINVLMPCKLDGRVQCNNMHALLAEKLTQFLAGMVPKTLSRIQQHLMYLRWSRISSPPPPLSSPRLCEVLTFCRQPSVLAGSLQYIKVNYLMSINVRKNGHANSYLGYVLQPINFHRAFKINDTNKNLTQATVKPS